MNVLGLNRSIHWVILIGGMTAQLAFACPTLSGTYACPDLYGDDVVTITESESKTVITTDTAFGNHWVETLYPDHVPRPIMDDSNLEVVGSNRDFCEQSVLYRTYQMRSDTYSSDDRGYADYDRYEGYKSFQLNLDNNLVIGSFRLVNSTYPEMTAPLICPRSSTVVTTRQKLH